MIDLNNFNQVKELIEKLFQNRKGFNDEVINSLTASYIYLEKNYPNEIPLEQIPDIKVFSRIKENCTGLSLGKIYLNRILNNVQEFVHDYSPDNCSEFVVVDKKVYVPNSTSPEWNNRLASWNTQNLSDQEKETLKQKIRAKVITHELIHASSFNGISVGFTYQSFGKKIDENVLKQIKETYKTNPYNIIYGQNLEEMITEVLALNIVENNRVESTKILGNFNSQISFRNRDSSNFTLNPLTEYIIRAYPEIVNYKFSNALQFLADFNDNNEMDLDVSSQLTYNALFTTCNSIKDNFKSNPQSSFNKLITLQLGCLNKYKKHINFDNIDDMKKCLLDFENFKFYAVKENGKIEEHLALALNEIEMKIKEQAQNLGISWDKYVQLSVKTNNEIIANSNELNLPYNSNLNQTDLIV